MFNGFKRGGQKAYSGFTGGSFRSFNRQAQAFNFATYNTQL